MSVVEAVWQPESVEKTEAVEVVEDEAKTPVEGVQAPVEEATAFAEEVKAKNGTTLAAAAH